MCGIAGLLSSPGRHDALVTSMTGSLAHRGPDDTGLWNDADSGVCLGHRRLAIVDLSPSGHQPMASEDERYVLVYNGELYNHLEIRREVEQAGGRSAWRGHSDTETLLAAISLWGLQPALERAVGMFAIALWDRRTRELHLARDRFGEKPLFYGWVGGDFVFASELKALRRHPRFANPINRAALSLFAARTYVPAPLSIWTGIHKLQPGTILTVMPGVERTPLDQAPEPGERTAHLRLEPYWSYREVYGRGLAQPFTERAEALAALEDALAASIRGQSVADVPVGAFLSGGIDSSAVVAMYRKHASGVIRTFSIGFEQASFNEAPYAAAVARHFDTEHHEHLVTVREAQEVIPHLADMYDEPFADSSQIPTHLVSRFAREHVTVALSGDGGDELFGGYNRYLNAARAWSALGRLPAGLRTSVGGALAGVAPQRWNSIARYLPGASRQPHFGTKVQKAFRTLAKSRGLDELYALFLDEWEGSASPVLGAPRTPAVSFDLDLGPGAPDVARMMYCDGLSYLPDDILCKVDRASMAVSLETRAPFLDHRVAEVAARIPLSMKIEGGRGKTILRDLLYREAPRELFERPKAGFAVPVGEWLRGPLRPWAEALIAPERLAREGYWDPAVVGARWREHLAGTRDSTPALWSVLMFQTWLERWGPDARAADPALLHAAAA